MSAPAIFVFGSNEAGVHGAGAARYAHQNCGAIWGQGFGLAGRSFAIPTKDRKIETLPLSEIAKHVGWFIAIARTMPEENFLVTRIGCGLAGYTDDQIAPMFRDAPDNCFLSMAFVKAIERQAAGARGGAN